MHILIVAYRFPPQTGGGVIRPHRFAKYLARAGEQVTVLTVDPGDGQKAADLPRGVRIVAVHEEGLMPRFSNLQDGRRDAFHRVRTRALVLARAALYQWLTPDNRAGFIAPAVRAATGEAGKGVDVVLTTGGPWSDFVAGDRIARRLGVPLVLDYRDPWNTIPVGWMYSPGLRTRLTARGLERGILSRADMVVSAHEGLPAKLEGELGLPGVVARSHWIPNGYDPEDFEGQDAVCAASSDPAARFTLTWAGSLYHSRSLEPIYRALSTLAREGAIDLARVRIRVLDRRPDRIRAGCADPALRACLETPGEIPHSEVIPLIMNSTVNLLVDLSYEGPVMHTPGKLYEYLRAGRPVLALTGEGVQADLVREAGAGWVVRPDDEAGIRNALLAAWRTWSGGGSLPSPRADVVERYDRARTTARLRELLGALVARSAVTCPS